MKANTYFNLIFKSALLLTTTSGLAEVGTADLNPKQLDQIESMGKLIFFDTQLSEPVGQSCGSCHQPDKAFANNFAVHSGANIENFTNRNTPSLAYISKTPEFRYDTIEGNIVPLGGLFWDGRVNTLEEQALAPFLNPLEMGNTNLDSLIKKVKKRPYFKKLMKTLKLSKRKDNEIILGVQQALMAYQNSREFNKFNSKYDLWLDRKTTLTTLEARGMVVFERIDKGNCAACHTLKKFHTNDQPLFTDFTYDNIGVPANLENPFYQTAKNINPSGNSHIDYGLGASDRIKDQRYLGMFKVPTLRNIELTAPYMHNGVFKDLREVVEFYNSRDSESRWGQPEVPYNVNDVELGNLKLTEIETDALVAFMKTLTDDYETN